MLFLNRKVEIRCIKISDRLCRVLSETYNPIPNIPRSDKKAKLFRPNSTKIWWFLNAFLADSLEEGKSTIKNKEVYPAGNSLSKRKDTSLKPAEDLRNRRNSSKLKCRFTIVFLKFFFHCYDRSRKGQKWHTVHILWDIIFRKLIKIVNAYENVFIVRSWKPSGNVTFQQMYEGCGLWTTLRHKQSSD